MRLERRAIRGLATAASAIGLLLLTFALPIPLWRTGEHALPALVYRPHGLRHEQVDPIWIDTDAACGTGRHRDPDDCLALVSLVAQQHRRIAGISTVFGNAPVDITDATARTLATTFEPGRSWRIWRGCGEPVSKCGSDDARAEAHGAIRAALRQRPLVFIALGPLTNLAAVVEHEPHLARQLIRVIAVMGRRPGHLFHPAEGRGQGGLLFGHGPVFRDLNVELDARAVEVVLGAGVELVLLPYSAARAVRLTAADLTFVAGQGRAGAWVAERSRDWLAFWESSVGIDGFYPFDLLASAFVQDASRFRCAEVSAWVGRDAHLPLYPRSPALLVSQDGWPGTPQAVGKAIYCDQVALPSIRPLFAR